MRVRFPFHAEATGRFLPIALAIAALVAVALPRLASAGPQHWGSGYPYLMSVETRGSRTALVAFEPPLRAKDATWISRWIDGSSDLKGLVPGGLAAGDFWPGDFGTEYVAAIVKSGSGYSIRVLKAPELFSTKPWKVVSTGRMPVSQIVALSTGDLLGKKSDQLLTVSKTSKGLVLSIIAPPVTPSGDQWTVAKAVKLPKLNGSIPGIACGDFWGERNQSLAIATSEGGKTRLSFYALGDDGLTLITTDAAKDLPKIAQNGLIAADYVKDGFDVLTLIPADPKARFQFRVAPLKSSKDKPSLGPLYTGRAMSRQWMPGTGLASSKIVMTGTFGDTAGKRTCFAAGRIFGYINSSLSTAVRKSHPYDPRPDAEIAFTHRVPTYKITEGAPNYGWPAKSETMGYEINLKNNGQTTIPAGSANLRVWINTPYRNADTKPETLGKPDFVIPIKEALPAFDPMNPKYLTVKVTTKWPYDLIPCGPGATWKKVNLDEVGERWLVVDLDCKGDTNLRNNRYEAAFHSYTYHPIFRENANLANRIPTVEGDPCSLEYLSRKMADAEVCVWERSATHNNEDVLQRAYFDGYEMGFPDAEKTQEAITKAWKVVQDKYEGWRELDIWWGENQSWEKFDWSYSAELHESGHLFHPLGDLYGLFVFPVWTSAAKMADGSPVQIMTHAWGPDLFAEGYAVISTPGCEVMKTSLVGSRGAGLERWWTTAPDQIRIRVLDRDGKPVPNAEVTAWRYFDNKPSASGKTGPDGCWDISYLLGKPTLDSIGRKHYYHEPENALTDAISQVFTVKIGSYQDCAVWGSEDQSANGRYTVLYHSYIDEKGWTWDFKTNYKPGADEPSFTADAAIEGSKVEIGITGSPNTKYRLYRRWEPSYIRNMIGEYDSTDKALEISQDLAAPDSRMGGRFRAIYEITEVNGTSESLPRVLTVTGLTKALGVTTQADGRLLVTTNSGRANPFCVLTDGKTYQEYFYHFRFGHTANKVAQSKATPGKYYATIAKSDLPGFDDHRFDVIDPLTDERTGYDVRFNIGNFRAKAATDTAPFTITMRSADDASKFNPGDGINATHNAIVTRVVGDTLYTDKAAFAVGQGDLNIDGVRLTGRVGDNAEMRELKDARGLDTVMVDGKEYIVIADTGNGRITVWNSGTGYVTHWQKDGSRPAAIATHPTDKSKFFALDRSPDRKSMLYLFGFDGKSLAVEPGYPVAVDTGDESDTTEIGLAAATKPGGDVVVAITDAEKARVIEMANTSTGWRTTATYTEATGTYAGDAALTRPTDVAYIPTKDGLKLYAIDGNDRLVSLYAWTVVFTGGRK